VMTEVHKALLALGCVWYPVTNYRVLCLWKHVSSKVSWPREMHGTSADCADQATDSSTHTEDMPAVASVSISDGQRVSRRSEDASVTSETTSCYVDAAIKVALSLYKVQQNIYLLDFQKVEVYSIVMHTRSRVVIKPPVLCCVMKCRATLSDS
jgi:hypothetical protein